MSTVVLVVHFLVAIGLIGLVLMQRSEGGALGIGGGSNSLISGRGAADVLARATGFLALAFFTTSIALTLMAGGAKQKASVLDEPTKPGWFDTLLPKKAPNVVAPPSTPAPASQFTTTTPAEPAAPTDVVPPPADSMQRAGPIDSTPLSIKPTAAPKISTPAPKPIVTVTPPKPVTAPTTTASTPKPKPAVGATKPAPAPAAESGEPAGPPGRAGPDE